MTNPNALMSDLGLLPVVHYAARGVPGDAPHCGRCNTGRMVLKTGTFGEFMGCSSYPACRNTTGANGQRRDFTARDSRTDPDGSIKPAARVSLNRKVEVLEELLNNAIERIETLEYYLEEEGAA